MSTSNIFSNVFIYGNCTVQGTFTSLGGSAVSQWTTSGSTIYYTTGNVGIGTNNPTGVNSAGSLLHIADSTSANPTVHVDASVGTGQARLHLRSGTGSTNRASRIDFFNNVLSSTVPQWTIISGYDQNGTNDMRYVNYAGAITMAWAQNGNIGIGTTNPGSLLTVSGGGSFGSGYNAFTAPTGGLIVQGNVGIGTSNPGVNALQVTGNVVTSGFTSNATNTVFNFDTLTVPFVNATQVGVGTTAPDNTIDAVGSIVIAPVTFIGASNYGVFFRRGFSTSNFYNCSVMAYDHSGDTYPDGISINGYDGVSICTGANTRQERVRVLGTNGYVGIGTTNPQYPLDIVGQPRYSIQPVLQSTQLAISSSAAAGWYRIASLGPTARAKFRIYTVGSNLQEQLVVTTAWSAAYSGYPTVRIEDQSSATFAGTAPLYSGGQVRTVVYLASNGTWYLEVYLSSVATAYTLLVQLIEGDATGASVTLTSPIVAGSIPTNYTAQPTVPVSAFSVTPFNVSSNSSFLITNTGNVGIGTTAPATILDVAGVISTNGLPLPYCIASGTGTFGTSYATTPAHGGSYFWYDRSSPIVIPQGANITIEIWGQSGYNQQGIAIDPYNSSTSQFNIQNTSQSGINEINATYYGTSITAVATDNTTQNPPWTMFSMLQNTTIAYYNWQQTIKFFNPPTPSGNSKVVCGTVNGSGLHNAGNCAQFTGSIGFYSSTIAYTVTGFRILLVTTSTTTFSSTYSYRVYVS